MGRVDEAMRRAAEAASARATSDAGEALLDRSDQAQAGSPDIDLIDPGTQQSSIDMRERKPVRPTTPTPFRVTNALSQKIVIDHKMAPSSREQYRRLAALLHHAQI